MLSIYISTVHFYKPLEKSCRDLSTQNIPPDNFYPKIGPQCIHVWLTTLDQVTGTQQIKK